MEIPYHGFWVVKFAVVRLVHGSSVRLDDHARNPEHRDGRCDRRSPDRKDEKALDEVYNQCLSMEMERKLSLNRENQGNKPPPEPPDILDAFENQRYISKLIQWSLEASKHERRRPH